MEELIIYKKYLDLMYYSNNLLKKYPKSERYCLVGNINTIKYKIMENIINSYKEKNKQLKLKLLNEIDTNLKILKVYVRISYKYKYININNYSAYSKKITNISNLLGGWISSCLRQ